MNVNSTSIFADIPKQLPDELCQTLLASPTVRIERIVSQGHKSQEGFWYDQDQNEWVMVLHGRGRLSFADSDPIELAAGDYLLIPAHCRHRVDWTAPDTDTIWLAIHFD